MIPKPESHLCVAPNSKTNRLILLCEKSSGGLIRALQNFRPKCGAPFQSLWQSSPDSNDTTTVVRRSPKLVNSAIASLLACHALPNLFGSLALGKNLTLQERPAHARAGSNRSSCGNSSGKTRENDSIGSSTTLPQLHQPRCFVKSSSP